VPVLQTTAKAFGRDLPRKSCARTQALRERIILGLRLESARQSGL
jgi:hypothetical protein